jgi:formate dehydrogenase major subunit
MVLPGGEMDIRKTFLEWPVVRQLTSKDPLGRGSAVQSQHTRAIAPRTATADRMVQSVCPYCAVGCGQRVFVKDEHVVQIEGDPDSPVSRGRLCPKGSASEQLVNSAGRATTMLYRRPRSTTWEKIGVEEATDMIADRMVESRRKRWQDTDEEGRPLRRTMGIAALGGATLDNEENYLIKKLFTAMGAIQIENQARI